MTSTHVRMLAEKFVRRNDSYGSAVLLADFLRELIESGTVELIEPKLPYTFGDVSVHLTETELATILAYTKISRKINAIKELRRVTGIDLKSAKDFVFGLEALIVRVREITSSL